MTKMEVVKTSLKTKDLLTLVKKMAYDGKNYNEIVQELNQYKNKLSNAEIESAIIKIDEFIVNYQLAIQEKSKALTLMLIGSLLFLLGVGITVYSYLISNRQYILVYGAILAGIWNIKEGYVTYHKPIEELGQKRRMYRR